MTTPIVAISVLVESFNLCISHSLTTKRNQTWIYSENTGTGLSLRNSITGFVLDSWNICVLSQVILLWDYKTLILYCSKVLHFSPGVNSNWDQTVTSIYHPGCKDPFCIVTNVRVMGAGHAPCALFHSRCFAAESRIFYYAQQVYCFLLYMGPSREIEQTISSSIPQILFVPVNGLKESELCSISQHNGVSVEFPHTFIRSCTWRGNPNLYVGSLWETLGMNCMLLPDQTTLFLPSPDTAGKGSYSTVCCYTVTLNTAKQEYLFIYGISCCKKKKIKTLANI